MQNHSQVIAKELSIQAFQVEIVSAFLDDGATIPFIARYRKEATGTLDEVQITAIRDRRADLIDLDKRRSAILASLGERDLLNETLSQAINAAFDLAALEDIYLPYRPKRRTRAHIAREKDLEPLAAMLYGQSTQHIELEAFVNAEKEVATVEEALSGAHDIMAEWISEDASIRARLRDIFNKKSTITSTVIKNQEEKGSKFRDYFAWQEPAGKVAGHRLLAMFRGEQEKILSLSFRPPEAESLAILHRCLVRRKDFAGLQVGLAAEDSYKRLLAPSLENELRGNLKKKADQEAIAVFADNLWSLMLLPICAVVASLALLVWSADRFVEGSASATCHSGMPPF